MRLINLGHFNRRDFCAIAGSTVASFALGSACHRSGGSDFAGDGRLTVRPHGDVKTAATGRIMLGLDHKDRERDAILQLPKNDGTSPLPLLVMLHGAGQSAEDMFWYLGSAHEEAGVAVLAPNSRDSTWDSIGGRFGPDVEFLNRVLERVFDTAAVDPARLAVGGFSDGATYALSLGLINGDLRYRPRLRAKACCGSPHLSSDGGGSMSHTLLSFLALILAIVLCSGLAPAQQSNSTAENTQTTDAPLRVKAFNLLESVADQVNTLQSAENRARLGSNIAESLWNHDEKRARTLLISVEDDIKAGLQNRESDDPRDRQTLMVFLRLRVDTVERIAKHDAELALAFLKATELSSDRPLPYGVAESERALELRLAKEIAGSNPDLALKLGRRSLARGFSNDLLSLLRQLYRKHKEQGLILYKEIIVKLRNANLAQDGEAMYFARSLAHSFTLPAADDSAFRDLINIFLASALANGCGNKTSNDERTGFCAGIASLVPEMEKIDPLRAAPLKRWAPEVQERETSRQAFNELSDLAQNGTVDEILALAPQYPQIEGEIYWQAMVKAESSGDIERARKIVTDYGGDPERRRLMLAQIDRDQIWASMNDEKLAEVQRRLSTIPRIQERVGFLLSVTNQIGASDRKAALKLLNQASGIVDTMKPGKEQTEAQMGLAMMYCLAKSDSGLAIMESLMPKLNDLVAAAAKLDGYDNRYLREGEWNMTGEGGVGNLLTRLAQNAGYFAWCDFDRSVSLAAQFERAELRLMAQLKLAQGILAGPPKRLLTDTAVRY